MNFFYLVWEPGNGYTKHRHENCPDAILESKRLAKKEPGKEFYVLQALVMSVTENPVKTIELEEPDYE